MDVNLIYDILTYLIVAIAVLIAFKKFLDKTIRKQKVSSSCADGCGGCTSKCDLKEFAATHQSKG